MTRFTRVMVVIDWLAAMAAGVALVVAVARVDRAVPVFKLKQFVDDTVLGASGELIEVDRFNEFIDLEQEDRTLLGGFTAWGWPAVVAGGVLVLLNVVWLITGVKALGREEFVGTETSAGRVKTAVSAIEDSLVRAAVSQPEVSSARVRVILGADHKTPARIIASAAFVETPNQLGAQQVLQDVLLDRFKEIVTLSERIPVDIKVVRFTTEKRNPAEKKSREERGKRTRGPEEEPEEFRGPRYPVGG